MEEASTEAAGVAGTDAIVEVYGSTDDAHLRGLWVRMRVRGRW